MFDMGLALMTGIDIPFPEIQAAIHQPTILEISYIGEQCFSIAISLLTIDKKYYFEDEPEILNNVTNFQIFCELVNNQEHKEEREQTINFLSLLFPNYNIFFTPQSIILNNKDQSKIIDETNFEIFQEILKNIFCLTVDKEKKLNPKGKKATEIANKMEKMRAKIAKMKQEERGGASTFASYISCLAVGLHYSLEDLKKITIYQMYDLLKRYSLYIQWDMDIRIRLTPGAQAQGEVEDWMRNIH